MELLEQIDARRREIHTDGYAMSIGEVISMYRDGDLDIHPEFQRIFRWSDEQKSRLIESILLGIPVPTIFVSQRDDGVWDVIDGVQRLSTVLQFIGVYRDEDGNSSPALVLEKTEYLPALEGHSYEEAPDATASFDDVLRRDFKRSKLDFVIVKKESDQDAKYDLFQRLNSGTQLSPQEARNCLLVMLDRTFYEWTVRCSKDLSFRTTVPLSQRKEDEGFRQELVLRFFLHHGYGGTAAELGKELGEYLTDWVRATSVDSEFDRAAKLDVFSRSFNLLKDAADEDTFRRWDKEKGRFLGPFSISAFEVITSGVSANLSYWESQPAESLLERIREIWDDPAFRTNSGTGVSPRRRMPRMVHYGRQKFSAPK